MPDLAICFDATGATDTHQLVDRLADFLSAGRASLNRISENDPHIAAINLIKPGAFAPAQPIRRNEAWLMLDGALFSGEAANPDTDEKRSGMLERLLEDLVGGNTAGLAALNGQFNAVAYDPAEQRLIIATDRLGSRPLYHGTHDGRHVVASEIKAVCAALGNAGSLSPVGLLELFAFGHNLGDKTVLEGIDLLPAGSVVTIDAHGYRAFPYFQYRYEADRSIANVADAAERIVSAVRAAVPHYLTGDGRDGIFLSGGLDSRIIAGAMEERSCDVSAFTFGYPSARDVLYAAQLSELLGFKHRTLTYPSVYLSQVIRDVVARTECATPFYHTTSLLFHDEIARAVDRIVVGFCGDVFSGGHLRPAMFRVDPGPELAGMIFARARCADRAALADIVQPDALALHWPAMVDGFSASVRSIEDQSGPDTADVWDVRHRQRRFTLTAPKVDRCRFEVLAPLLDNRVIDLVLSLPAWARKGQRAYRQAIVEGFPSLRDVPWAATGRPIPVSPLRGRMQEGLRLTGKAFRLALNRIGLGKKALDWQFRDLAAEFREDTALFEEHLSPFLKSALFPEDLLNRQGIRKLMDSHRLGRMDATHLLGSLLTVAVFCDLHDQWARGLITPSA